MVPSFINEEGGDRSFEGVIKLMSFERKYSGGICLLSLSFACMMRMPTFGGQLVQPSISTGKEVDRQMFNLRDEVKKQIDELSTMQIVSMEHTTDGLPPPPSIKKPETPQPFDAGKFKIVFAHGETQKAFICQTETKVGHYARVVPGETDVGGEVLLLEDPRGDDQRGSKLTADEVDYFIQALYKKFSQPLSDEEAWLLNHAKDAALAIFFSQRNGIEQYHKGQLKTLQ
jgi:hypothetical protein